MIFVNIVQIVYPDCALCKRKKYLRESRSGIKSAGGILPRHCCFFNVSDGSFGNDQVLGILDLHDLVHPSLMPAAFELSVQPLVSDHLGHLHSDDAGAECVDVGVVVHL